MRCRKCGTSKVNVSFQQTGVATSHRGKGIVGHTNNAARSMSAIGSLGMSNLFWKKSKGSSKTRIVNQKVALCQVCGFSWNVL